MKRKSSNKRIKRLPREKAAYAECSKVVRLSPELHEFIKKSGHRDESYDNILRRLLGLTATKYTHETSKTYYVIDDLNSPHIFEDAAEARGQAVRMAVKNGLKEVPAVRKLKSLP